MYGKLENEILIPAPKMLHGEGVNVWNPPAEMYLTQGWKPVMFTDEPEAPIGYYYQNGWSEDNDKIMQTWELIPLSDDIDEGEAYDIIFGDIE